jgi:hypothetical protein
MIEMSELSVGTIIKPTIHAGYLYDKLKNTPCEVVWIYPQERGSGGEGYCVVGWDENIYNTGIGWRKDSHSSHRRFSHSANNPNWKFENAEGRIWEYAIRGICLHCINTCKVDGKEHCSFVESRK